MNTITGQKVSLIAMVHVLALPGTPGHRADIATIRRNAAEEARIYADQGFDAIMIENMHDAPYLNRSVGPEIVSTMTAIACDIYDAVEIPLGVQVLAGANKEALAVALASGARFIRAEGFVYAHVADEGLMQSDAGELLRYRKTIGAESIKIAADIKKKHSSHALTADVDLEHTAEAAEFFGADMLIVTGTSTGKPTNPADLAACARGSKLPRLVGSGANPETMAQLWPHCSGIVVGSYIKKDGRWNNPIDTTRCAAFVRAAELLR